MSDEREIDWNERTTGDLDEMSNSHHAHLRRFLEAMIPGSVLLQPGPSTFVSLSKHC